VREDVVVGVGPGLGSGVERAAGELLESCGVGLRQRGEGIASGIVIACMESWSSTWLPM
jgi:hypothetical protein